MRDKKEFIDLIISLRNIIISNGFTDDLICGVINIIDITKNIKLDTDIISYLYGLISVLEQFELDKTLLYLIGDLKLLLSNSLDWEIKEEKVKHKIYSSVAEHVFDDVSIYAK